MMEYNSTNKLFAYILTITFIIGLLAVMYLAWVIGKGVEERNVITDSNTSKIDSNIQ